MNRELRRVQTQADAARQATAFRDLAILTAVEHGESLRTVADAAGLSHTAIAKIVARTSHMTATVDGFTVEIRATTRKDEVT